MIDSGGHGQCDGDNKNGTGGNCDGYIDNNNKDNNNNSAIENNDGNGYIDSSRRDNHDNGAIENNNGNDIKNLKLLILK